VLFRHVFDDWASTLQDRVADAAPLDAGMLPLDETGAALAQLRR
jgi:hypothetical protein